MILLGTRHFKVFVCSSPATFRFQNTGRAKLNFYILSSLFSLVDLCSPSVTEGRFSLVSKSEVYTLKYIRFYVSQNPLRPVQTYLFMFDRISPQSNYLNIGTQIKSLEGLTTKFTAEWNARRTCSEMNFVIIFSGLMSLYRLWITIYWVLKDRSL